MEYLWAITHLRKILLWGIINLQKKNYGASLILRKYYGALLTSPDKLWGISQNRKIEKCDPPPYHDLLMTAPLSESLYLLWDCSGRTLGNSVENDHKYGCSRYDQEEKKQILIRSINSQCT